MLLIAHTPKFVRRSREQPSSAGAERAVLEARYFLTSLTISSGALSLRNSHESYHGVTGSFCPLDWHLQKSNPSTMPMFRDLVAASHHCKQHAVTLDISHIVKEARHFDQYSQGAPHELQIGGLVFHETRCGSTLTANLLSAADPPAHRVYSEASPLLSTLVACKSSDCSKQKQDDLIRDVLYLMGRSSDIREKRVFYKIQSVGVRDIATIFRVIPNVPWMFIYRNSVEVMMSHFKNGSITNKAVCLRGRNTPHPLITEIALEHGRAAKSLTNAEYCAAHLVRTVCIKYLSVFEAPTVLIISITSNNLHHHIKQASLCQAAIQQYDATNHGRFVNYADLPDILWDDIFVNYFQIPRHSLHHKEMLKAANVYSKGRGNKANQEWQQDSAHKQEQTSPEIQQAAEDFLQPLFEKLQDLSHLHT